MKEQEDHARVDERTDSPLPVTTAGVNEATPSPVVRDQGSVVIREANAVARRINKLAENRGIDLPFDVLQAIIDGACDVVDAFSEACKMNACAYCGDRVAVDTQTTCATCRSAQMAHHERTHPK